MTPIKTRKEPSRNRGGCELKDVGRMRRTLFAARLAKKAPTGNKLGAKCRFSAVNSCFGRVNARAHLATTTLQEANFDSLSSPVGRRGPGSAAGHNMGYRSGQDMGYTFGI